MLIDGFKQLVINHCPNIPVLSKALARARIYSFERYLLTDDKIYRGEQDIEVKMEILQEQMKKFPSYAEKLKKEADEIFHSAPLYEDRKDLDQVQIDLLFCCFAYGFSPEEYVFFFLEGKSMEERLAYVSHIKRICAAFRMNDLSSMQLLNDKWKTYKLLKPFYKREAIMINKTWHYARFKTFVEKHPIFVKKQFNLSCGESVAKIDVRSCGKSEKELFNELIKMGKIIIEELIVQHSQMAIFNPESVNTIRCVTMNTRHGIKIFPFSFMRNGRQGSFVDNGGAGGILIGVDDSTGKIDTDGIDELGRVFSSHPDTNIVYKGYQLPEWEEMLCICKKMAEYLPKMKYCAWDMAYTDKGWLVVEGNRIGQMIAQQMTINKGIKMELDAFMADMDLAL